MYVFTVHTQLLIIRGNRDNLKTIFLIFHKNICYDPSLEPSHRDGSNEGSQCIFYFRNKENYQVPVVQSIISLMSSLRGQLVKCFTTL